MMSQKKSRWYELTPKGLMAMEYGENNSVLDKILLYCIKTDKNALIWDDKDKQWIFEKVIYKKKGVSK